MKIMSPVLNIQLNPSHQDKICSISKFNYAWSSEEGCVRLQHGAALVHANGEPHKTAYEYSLKEQGSTPRERTEKLQRLLNNVGQSSIIGGF